MSGYFFSEILQFGAVTSSYMMLEEIKSVSLTPFTSKIMNSSARCCIKEFVAEVVLEKNKRETLTQLLARTL